MIAHIRPAQIARRASLSQFCTLPRRANHNDDLGHPASPRRGVARDRHDTRGGEAVAVRCRSMRIAHADERCITDAKSCGPGLPVLRPAQRVSVVAMGAIKPVPKESAYKR
jgi:hypothetical protein